MSCLVVSPVAGCVMVAIICSLVKSEIKSELLYSLCKHPLALDPRHQLLDLHLLLAAERQERQPRRAPVIAVEIHGMLHARNTEVADYALGSQFQAFLFFAGERGVSVFERGIDFVTRHGCRTSKGENRADCSQSER